MAVCRDGSVGTIAQAISQNRLFDGGVGTIGNKPEPAVCMDSRGAVSNTPNPAVCTDCSVDY